MHPSSLIFISLISIYLFQCKSDIEKPSSPGGDARVWQPMTFQFEGGETLDEEGDPNPFLDYRLDMTFSLGDRNIKVPGYFAADGNPGQSGASAGNIWKVHFTPDAPGSWRFQVSFRKGEDVAISDAPGAGQPGDLDGQSGSFEVIPAGKGNPGPRARGRLAYAGERYLKFAGSQDYFLKGGADSPENFLGYSDFDGTYYSGNAEHRQGESAPNLGLHAYEPHITDWKSGDPSWQGGKGKGIIGALNYLAGKGMNSVYMLTMNVRGDGDDVWPWTRHDERFRFDCSKLDQWNTVFDHMDSLGLMIHFVLQETENETLLDGGDLGRQRKLYLRELVARFAQHLAITWNLGEEHGPASWTPNGQTVQQTMDMASYLRKIDPYDNFIVVHTHSDNDNRERLMEPLLGFEDIDGPSIQVGNPRTAHAQTLEWIDRSAESGHPWVVCLDEIGQAWKGALPDAIDPGHDTIRHNVLWGNLMAGGGGVEWYFGYRFAHNDLNAEDWRSRDKLWDQTRFALDFFHQYLPFPQMESRDELGLADNDYCLALEGETYALYLPKNTKASLNLRGTSGDFTVHWYNPRKGGSLQTGSLGAVKGGSEVSLGDPPSDPELDWVALVRRQ